MSKKHLTLSERYCIENMLELGYKKSDITLYLKLSASVVYKEIARNLTKGSYSASKAQALYVNRRKVKYHKITGSIEKLIVYLLHKGLSPELIAGRLLIENKISISFKAIYNYIYKNNIKRVLFFKGKRYKYKHEKRSGAGVIKNRVNISERSEAANSREEQYHYEGDTIVGKNHKGAIVTMVDRKSRHTMLAKATDRTADAINKVIYKMSNSNKIKTITFDNGKEFAKHEILSLKTGAKIYFADPYSPWQRGSNENINRYIRQSIPKSTDFGTVSHEFLRNLEITLNNRPKKCLNYLTPNEVHFGVSLSIETTI